jgi:hypothetical protein
VIVRALRAKKTTTNVEQKRSKSSWNSNRERMNFVCPQVS